MARFRKLKNEYEGYEFCVGKSFVCIRNKNINYREVIKKEDIAYKIETYEDESDKYLVTPAAIIYWIKNGKRPPDEVYATRKCRHENRKLGTSDYEYAANDRCIFVSYCDECFYQDEMDS